MQSRIRSLKIGFIFLLLLPWGGKTLFAQAVNEAHIKMMWIYNFTNHITWPDEKKMKEFSIGILGSDPDLSYKMDEFAEEQTIKGLKVKIEKFKNINSIIKTNILFVSKDKTAKAESILEKIAGNNTLMITDNCNLPKFVMINLVLKEKKMVFEINKSNIIFELLGYSPDILLLGGTELEVATLFKETEKSLKTEKEKVKSQQEELSVQSAEIEKQKSRIKSQQDQIKIQQKSIDEQKIEFEKLMADIEAQKEILASKSLILETQIAKIKLQNEKMNGQQSTIHSQDSIVAARSALLDQQKDAIFEQQSRINDQKEKMSSQSSKIETQESIIYLAVGSLCVFIVLLFFIYRGYRIKQKINAQLEQQNVQILEQRDKLNLTNVALADEKALVEQTLTDLKSTQSQLVNSEKMASLGQLTAGVAHEINNPVNYISGGIVSLKANFEDLLEIINSYEQITTENASEQLEKVAKLKKEIEYQELIAEIDQLTKSIKNGADQTATIVKGLRIFSRLDEDALKIANVHENIDSTLIILHSKYKDNVEIVKDYGDIPQIECYPGKLNQVYMNIISNAIQAIEGKGKIFISTSFSENGKGNEVVIKIKDTGGGIPEHVKSRIFEPFFTTKDVGKGTGLGLSISAGIVENHNGRLEVDSVEGEGTEFRIILPVNAKAA